MKKISTYTANEQHTHSQANLRQQYPAAALRTGAIGCEPVFTQPMEQQCGTREREPVAPALAPACASLWPLRWPPTYSYSGDCCHQCYYYYYYYYY